MVERCTIVGVREGIVTHMSMVDVTHNHIGETTLRGITMGEMSMGAISHNDVLGAHGVGIICLDHSECSIEHNTIVGTTHRSDRRSRARGRRDRGALLRQGAGQEQHGDREPRRHPGVRQLDDRRDDGRRRSSASSRAPAIRASSTCRGTTPLEEWDTPRLVNLIRGISRHIVRFVEYDGALYALKELPERPARREWTLLRAAREPGPAGRRGGRHRHRAAATTSTRC